MERTYKYENGIVYISGCDTYDHKNLQKATEKFLKNVIKERVINGNTYTTGNFRKE